MNVRDFEYIAKIAKFNSISKAAESLYVSQPTLTKFLQKLEKEIGHDLFYRSGKKFSPTPIGEIYIAKAIKILELNEQLQQEVKDKIDFKMGTVKIGVTAGRSNFVTEMVLPKFAFKFPDIKVILEIQRSEELVKMINDDELDVAIITGNAKQADIDYIEIALDELAIIAHKDSEIVKKSKKIDGFKFNVVTAKDWENEKFVLPSIDSMSMTMVQEYFKTVDKQPKIIAQVQDIRAAISAVAAGVGIGMFVSVPIKERDNLTYLSLGNHQLKKQQVSIITKKTSPITLAKENLITIIKENYTNY